MENASHRDIQENTEKLFDAIDDGNIEVVEEVLSNEEVDINCVSRGATPLIFAVIDGHHNIVRRLLEVPGIKLGIVDFYGNAALHHACLDNNISIVKLLCQDSRCSPGVVNKKSMYGKTALMIAVSSRQHEIVRRLLEVPGIQLGKTNSYGNAALHHACLSNNVSIVKLLCQDSRCCPSLVNMKNKIGFTPLMIAVHNGNLDIVKELDMEGSDFFAKDDDGTTLIEVARRNNDFEVLKYLIERNKVDSLKVIAGHNVARHEKNKADVETLEIPETLRYFLAGLVDSEDNLDTDDDADKDDYDVTDDDEDDNGDYE